MRGLLPALMSLTVALTLISTLRAAIPASPPAAELAERDAAVVRLAALSVSLEVAMQLLALGQDCPGRYRHVEYEFRDQIQDYARAQAFATVRLMLPHVDRLPQRAGVAYWALRRDIARIAFADRGQLAELVCQAQPQGERPGWATSYRQWQAAALSRFPVDRGRFALTARLSHFRTAFAAGVETTCYIRSTNTAHIPLPPWGGPILFHALSEMGALRELWTEAQRLVHSARDRQLELTARLAIINHVRELETAIASDSRPPICPYGIVPAATGAAYYTWLADLAGLDDDRAGLLDFLFHWTQAEIGLATVCLDIRAEIAELAQAEIRAALSQRHERLRSPIELELRRDPLVTEIEAAFSQSAEASACLTRERQLVSDLLDRAGHELTATD